MERSESEGGELVEWDEAKEGRRAGRAAEPAEALSQQAHEQRIAVGARRAATRRHLLS